MLLPIYIAPARRSIYSSPSARVTEKQSDRAWRPSSDLRISGIPYLRKHYLGNSRFYKQHSPCRLLSATRPRLGSGIHPRTIGNIQSRRSSSSSVVPHHRWSVPTRLTLVTSRERDACRAENKTDRDNHVWIVQQGWGEGGRGGSDSSTQYTR